MSKAIVLKGAAVHTRDEKLNIGMDYGWHARKGDMSLFDGITEIHRTGLRDTSGHTRKFALIIAQERAGLLFCDMVSPRDDGSRRHIHDTLYLEFDGAEKAALLEYAAWLLTCTDAEYNTVQKQAVAYAEPIYLNRENQDTKDDSCPFFLYQCNTDSLQFSGKRALRYKGDANTVFSDDPDARKCAAFLKWLAKEYENRAEKKSSVVFVSTGRVGIERCRQIAEKYDTCLILTMTSEIQTEINLGENIFLTALKKKYYVKDITRELQRILKKKCYLKDIAQKLRSLFQNG